MDVSSDGDAEFFPDFSKDSGSFFDTGASVGVDGGPVGLIVEALKMKGTPTRSVISLSARAMRHAKSSFSSPQGPRMKKGEPEPTSMSAILKVFMIF